MPTTVRGPLAFLLAMAWLGGDCLAADGVAADRPVPLAAIRAEVQAAIQAASGRKGFEEQARGVRQLVDLDRRLQADPRFETAVAIRGLERLVVAALVRAGRELRTVATAPSRSTSVGQGLPAAGGAPGGRQAEAQALIDLIQATVRPECWDVNGGQGRIVYFANGHSLVVLAPDDVHDDLGGLLDQLR